MPRRRELTDEALKLIAAACEVCTDLDEQPNLMEERRQLWRQAYEAGATHGQIAEPCGVSEHLVRLEIAKARGAEWATGGRA